MRWLSQISGGRAANKRYWSMFVQYKIPLEQIILNAIKLQLDSYAFTISWPRVLPNGLKNNISKDGLQYYINLTKELVKNGIEPIVTLDHWDYPQDIEDIGGWLNESIVNWFADYAKIMFHALGDYVKKWITWNQPFSSCLWGYQNAVLTTLGIIKPRTFIIDLELNFHSEEKIF